jgi:hypothetical protein
VGDGVGEGDMRGDESWVNGKSDAGDEDYSSTCSEGGNVMMQRRSELEITLSALVRIIRGGRKPEVVE